MTKGVEASEQLIFTRTFKARRIHVIIARWCALLIAICTYNIDIVGNFCRGTIAFFSIFVETFHITILKNSFSARAADRIFF